MPGEYIFVFSFFFSLSLFFFGKWKRKKRPGEHHPPSLPSLPLVGSLPFLRNFQNVPKFLMEKSHQLGSAFTLKAGSKLVLVLNTKEVIEEALVRNSRSFSSRPEMFMQKLINPNGKGMVFMDSTNEWKRTHQLSLSILKDFGFGDKNILEDRILKEVEAMLDYIRKKKGKSFDAKELTFLAISNIMTGISFGSRTSYDLGLPELIIELDRYAHNMDMTFDVMPFIKFIPTFRRKISSMKMCGKRAYDILEREMTKSLQCNEKSFTTEYLKKEGLSCDREHLNFILRDLIAAGTDTAANTILWSLVALANHPEIQKRLQEDIDTVIHKERMPTLQDQLRLPFVEATILEVFRWRTQVPLSIAHCTKHDSILRKYLIPAGTLVLPNLYAAHGDPLVWQDPDSFKPERFLGREGNVIGRDRVITFSLGRRSCLGETLARAEIFLILTSLLQRFTVLPPEGQGRICEEPQLPVDILQIPRAFSVRLMKR